VADRHGPVVATTSNVRSVSEVGETMVVFDPERHIKNVLGDTDVALLHSNGTVLPGILGRAGAGEDACVGIGGWGDDGGL
jgi:hypothetical protein